MVEHREPPTRTTDVPCLGCRVPCAEARGRRDRCAAPAREPPRGAMLSPGCYGVEHAPQLSDRIARGGCFAMCVSLGVQPDGCARSDWSGG